ncbi:hypothetical protein D9611_014810 [Ephemerocybe angulata]|uniref:Transcription factor CBF/NF-Y/archaeal histone domain-containing protein n=1 Tax=Ephemerocybe angulata TaxID=980116 RepID=A0A8H5CC61_9AGAR|nr:hypothetical protein D9611_014810 [Tulosesus angulatus]
MSAQQQPPPFVQSGEPLNQFLKSFWQRQIDSAEKETPDYRHPPLPLARIKKVMKSDPDVKMIAADGMSFSAFETLFRDKGLISDIAAIRFQRPSCFARLAKFFISEITARAFIIADSNKRRTLSRADIAKALSKSDQFDFLIDIVPREDLPFPGTSTSNGGNGKKNANIAAPKANQVPAYYPMRQPTVAY